MTGRIGASATTQTAPWKRNKQARARRRQEARWRAKCGPVTVRFVDPATLRKDSVRAD
jgi:hypothetical protein